MSCNYSANQYNREFKPQRLRNWEVPKWYPERPKFRKTATQFIANDRGHLLPGVARSGQTPWGRYVGTWDLPRKITRKTAEELTAPPQAASEFRQTENETRKALNQYSSDKENFRTNSLVAVPRNDKDKPKQPTPFSYHTPQTLDTSDFHCSTQNHNEFLPDEESVDLDARNAASPSPKKKTIFREFPSKVSFEGPPLADAYSAFQIARNLSMENRRHQPLPDVVQEGAYREMDLRFQQEGRRHQPSAGASAVGWRDYKSPGPTECSKMRIFRPRTAGDASGQKPESSSRPKTSVPKLRRQKRVTEMDLAIGWDIVNGMTPSSSRASPIPEHSDTEGHSTVQSFELERAQPKVAWDDCRSEGSSEAKAATDIPRDSANDFSSSNQETADGTFPETNTEEEMTKTKLRPKTAKVKDKKRYNEIVARENSSTSNSDTNVKSVGRRSKSSPNLTSVGVQTWPRLLKARPCIACELKPVPDVSQKSEYKLAFKAGKPNLRPFTPKPEVEVPKPKIPFAKKSYSIPTLAPPFSLWPGSSTNDYPDHWRLASIYQHSYKPLLQRKKPLLKSVFM